MTRPSFSRRNSRREPTVRVNHRIRAKAVRVVSEGGQQLGVMSVQDAMKLARDYNVDLVEVAAQADPPVCRLIDYGKYKYEESKKKKENKKHQHSNKVKEIQLRPLTDPHDFQYKLDHAIDFLCEDMKVKVSLRFKGRENAHREYGFQAVEKFIEALNAWGHSDAQPKLIGRGITVMVSPLPKSKRAEHPNPKRQADKEAALAREAELERKQRQQHEEDSDPEDVDTDAESQEFQNPAFEGLDLPEENES